MSFEVLVASHDPLMCLTSYCKHNNMKFSHIINQLIIDDNSRHLADHAVKFEAIDKESKNSRIFIAMFKRAVYSGIFLTNVREIRI